MGSMPLLGAGKAPGGGAAWTPASLGANLLLWEKADAGAYVDGGDFLCADGDTVNLWQDQSGVGNHLSQSASGRRPTYGTSSFNSSYKGLTFLAADEESLGSSALSINSTTFSYFVLFTGTVNSGSYGRLLSVNRGGLDANNPNSICCGVEGGANANGWCYGDGAFRGNGGAVFPITLGSPQLIGFVSDGSNINVYRGAAVQGAASAWTTAVGGAGSSNVIIGNKSTAGGAEAFDGVVAEAILANSAMSAGDIAGLVAYLNARWGTAL